MLAISWVKRERLRITAFYILLVKPEKTGSFEPILDLSEGSFYVHNPQTIVNVYYDFLTDEFEGSSKESNGFSDVELGWRRFLWTDGRQVLSSQLNLIVPLGYDIEDDPRLGYGRFGLEGSIQYGTSL